MNPIKSLRKQAMLRLTPQIIFCGDKQALLPGLFTFPKQTMKECPSKFWPFLLEKVEWIAVVFLSHAPERVKL